MCQGKTTIVRFSGGRAEGKRRMVVCPPPEFMYIRALPVLPPEPEADEPPLAMTVALEVETYRAQWNEQDQRYWYYKVVR